MIVDDNTLTFLSFNDPNNPWYCECNKKWTVYGNPSISKAKAYLNTGSSLRVAGISTNMTNYIHLNNIMLGGHDFTIDFWVYVESGSDLDRIIGLQFSEDAKRTKLNRCPMCINIFEIDGCSVCNLASYSKTDKWQHRAQVYIYEENSMYYFIDGICVFKYPLPNDFFTKSKYVDINLGCEEDGYWSGSHSNFVGYIDNFRISNCSRWKENFNLLKLYDTLIKKVYNDLLIRIISKTYENNFNTKYIFKLDNKQFICTKRNLIHNFIFYLKRCILGDEYSKIFDVIRKVINKNKIKNNFTERNVLLNVFINKYLKRKFLVIKKNIDELLRIVNKRNIFSLYIKRNILSNYIYRNKICRISKRKDFISKFHTRRNLLTNGFIFITKRNVLKNISLLESLNKRNIIKIFNIYFDSNRIITWSINNTYFTKRKIKKKVRFFVKTYMTCYSLFRRPIFAFITNSEYILKDKNRTQFTIIQELLNSKKT